MPCLDLSWLVRCAVPFTPCLAPQPAYGPPHSPSRASARQLLCTTSPGLNMVILLTLLTAHPADAQRAQDVPGDGRGAVRGVRAQVPGGGEAAGASPCRPAAALGDFWAGWWRGRDRGARHATAAEVVPHRRFCRTRLSSRGRRSGSRSRPRRGRGHRPQRDDGRFTGTLSHGQWCGPAHPRCAARWRWWRGGAATATPGGL